MNRSFYDFLCGKCGSLFNTPLLITAQSAEYPGARAWSYTTEHCPDCKSQHVLDNPEARAS